MDECTGYKITFDDVRFGMFFGCCALAITIVVIVFVDSVFGSNTDPLTKIMLSSGVFILTTIITIILTTSSPKLELESNTTDEMKV